MAARKHRARPALIDAHAATEPEAEAPAPVFRDEDGAIAPEFLNALATAIEAEEAETVRALAAPLHEADLADLIVALVPERRADFVRLLGEEFDYAALTELDESVRVEILEALPAAAVARGIGALESDDAVYILEDLDEADKSEILAQIPIADRIALQRGLDYPEDSAGRLMQTDFIAVPPFWSVGQTIDYVRSGEDLPEAFYEIYVIDPSFRLVGTVPLDRLLRTGRPAKIESLVKEMPYKVALTEDQEEVARLFQRYNLVSVAAVDDAERLVGIVTIDDVVDVIQEEAGEDLRLLAGVGDEEISDTVLDAIKSRWTWLVVNLGTAILASLVIALFDATIQQMVALAVLMPIVASMGGNAGTQTMTVAVRALATRELGSLNARRIVRREVIVGVLNGVFFALVMGAIAFVWFGNGELGLVIAVAMIINMISAGLSGILIPIALDRMKIDPAIASSVFVTTVTDVVGFFAFLGVAAWWFAL